MIIEAFDNDGLLCRWFVYDRRVSVLRSKRYRRSFVRPRIHHLRNIITKLN